MKRNFIAKFRFAHYNKRKDFVRRCYMRYMTCADAAAIMKITTRRVQQMCKDGEIPGAIKQGGVWMVPWDGFEAVRESANAYHVEKKPLPIGESDYKTASTQYYYVDKTLMIRDFLDTMPKVSLFTRPRRFGKTLNMDMLRVFFEKTDEDTSVYFRDKNIWKCGEKYTSYQGKYPVIFLTFKDVKFQTWEETFGNISDILRSEFGRHVELTTSAKCSKDDMAYYDRICSKTATTSEMTRALSVLSEMLYTHHGEKVIIIIDEYDTPIQQGHSNGFYDEVVLFMCNFFSGGMKDNSYLAFGFMTGILRVAKESIFSGLNNLRINSLLEEEYSQYFGFTQEEVMEMLRYYNAADKFQEVCDWYDGYLFGGTEIFNPWSMLNYIADKCVPKAFWTSTGSNEVIAEVLREATPEILEALQKLLRGESVMTYIDTNVIYPEIQKNPYMIYSFLLVTGYLRISEKYLQEDGNYFCKVAIPNREIAYVYKKEVLDKTKQHNFALEIQQSILMGETKALQKHLEKFMLNTISSFDTANEAFYHGMMLGLCAVLSINYQVYSNRESGLGRFDIMLLPRKKELPGFIFEFKYTKEENADLEMLAAEALEQIEDKKYETELREAGVQDIVKMGIAFRGKEAVVRKE